MAILRIFWAEALHPALANVYHRNRTISLLGLAGSNVGWDMPIEKETLMISNNVARASFDAIRKYIQRLNPRTCESCHREALLRPPYDLPAQKETN
eukprot:2076723-Prymnesium_polylepis.1